VNRGEREVEAGSPAHSGSEGADGRPDCHGGEHPVCWVAFSKKEFRWARGEWYLEGNGGSAGAEVSHGGGQSDDPNNCRTI
jgi:hypothetical protein